jgi:poly-gamma-glutamate biosynthesis protein PgsC/CapC
VSETEILYIGIGLFVSLLYSEAFGVAPGGIIVPGYLALGVGDPLAVGLTLGVGLLTFFIVRVLSTVTILYGRRRTALMILVAFLIGSLLRAALGVGTLIGPFETEVIGYIVPGLIDSWRISARPSFSCALIVNVSSDLFRHVNFTSMLPLIFSSNTIGM